MRYMAVWLAVMMLAGAVVMPAVTQAASSQSTPPPIAGALRAVDRRVDASLRAMKAAEDIADRRHLRGIDADLDQGLRLMHEGEEKVDQALALVRTLTSQDSPHARTSSG